VSRQRLVEIIVLWIIGAPSPGVIDSHEGERRTTALEHVGAVLHEHLPRILHARMTAS